MKFFEMFKPKKTDEEMVQSEMTAEIAEQERLMKSISEKIDGYESAEENEDVSKLDLEPITVSENFVRSSDRAAANDNEAFEDAGMTREDLKDIKRQGM